MVKVAGIDADDPDCLEDVAEDVSRDMMEPFYESGAGCRPEYLRFEVTEVEDLKKFTEEKISVVKYPDGTMKRAYNHKFRNPDWSPFQSSEKDATVSKYIYPEECEVTEATFEEFYPDFETFEMEYMGHERNEAGEWGYRHNPQGYVDRCCLDGAASILTKTSLGKLAPFREVSIARIGDIDFNAMEHEAEREMREWWSLWEDVASGKLEDDPIFGVYYDLYQMGLHRMVNEAEYIAAREKFPDDRRKWIEAKYETDDFSREWFMENMKFYFKWRTYAVVETDGTWNSPGKMGFFALSDESVEDGIKWATDFWDRFLLNEDEDTVVVVLDCHV